MGEATQAKGWRGNKPWQGQQQRSDGHPGRHTSCNGCNSSWCAAAGPAPLHPYLHPRGPCRCASTAGSGGRSQARCPLQAGEGAGGVGRGCGEWNEMGVWSLGNEMGVWCGKTGRVEMATAPGLIPTAAAANCAVGCTHWGLGTQPATAPLPLLCVAHRHVTEYSKNTICLKWCPAHLSGSVPSAVLATAPEARG